VLVVEPGPAQTTVITVEPDASSMSYFLAAAALTGTQVEVEGLGTASVQGDVGFARILEHMGCTLHMTDRSIRLTGGPLTGLDIDCGAMPDIVPTLAVVAARARGASRIRGIAHLRTKESDRIHALAVGLQRLGVTAEEGSDSLTIHPGPLSPGTLPTFEDHRIAMAFAVLGLVVDGLGIDDPDCVTKSFPDFWRELARFRAHHEGSVSA
jgi:3-phosphoshikimate 1-carboxyvinyltransferase